MTIQHTESPASHPILRSNHVRGAVTSVVIAALWLVLALWRPNVTYHLGPVLVAGAWPWAIAGVPRRSVVSGAAGGFAIAMLGGLMIQVIGAMDGPTLWSEGNAFAEVPLGAALGAVLGAVSALRRAPR